MSRVRFYAALSAFMFMLLTAMSVNANEEKKQEEALPGEIVSDVTTKLLTTVKENEALIKSDPDAYFSKLRVLLEPVIDFETIAKLVMGKKSWVSVEEKDQQLFINNFTDSLVRTYGKAMSSFANLDIEVAKTWPSDNPKSKNYYVQQDVTLEGGVAHIIYNMYPAEDGWKVRNVTIRDAKGYKLNMGKTFNSQFKHALSENDGNVLATIESWGKE